MRARMTKADAINQLVLLLAPRDPAERHRLREHHARRDTRDVIESLDRQRAIMATTKAEMMTHCQLAGLPRL